MIVCASSNRLSQSLLHPALQINAPIAHHDENKMLLLSKIPAHTSTPCALSSSSVQCKARHPQPAIPGIDEHPSIQLTNEHINTPLLSCPVIAQSSSTPCRSALGDDVKLNALLNTEAALPSLSDITDTTMCDGRSSCTAFGVSQR